MPEPLTSIRVVPANQASWDDVQAGVGARGAAAQIDSEEFQAHRAL